MAPKKEENTNTNQNQQNSTKVVKEKSKFLKYALSHKLIVFLLLLLLVVFIWGEWNIFSLKRENKQLNEELKTKIENVTEQNYKSVATVYSWAVRAELMRNNLDLVNQYTNNIIKDEKIKKAFVVDLTDNKITASSVSEEIGLPVSEISLTNTEEKIVQLNDSIIRIQTPITGLNSIIAISAIELVLR